MIYVADTCRLDSELLGAALQGCGLAIEVCPADVNLPTRVGAGAPDALIIGVNQALAPELDALRRVRGAADAHETVIIALCRDMSPESIMALVLAGADDIIDRNQASLETAIDGVERALRRELPTWWPSRLAEQGHTPATLRRIRSGEQDQASAGGGSGGAARHASSALQATGRDAAVWEGPSPQDPADSDGALRALRPLVKRQEMQALLDGVTGIRAISPAVAEALRVCGQPDASLKDVVAAIRVDQAMAVKVLTLANSPLYTRGDHVRSLQQAVGRIGIHHIRRALMNLAVMERFSSADGPLDPALFWEHSISTGLIFAELAKPRPGADPDAAFTLGLLHDIGRVALADALGPLYARVVEAASASGLPLEQVEKRLLLVDHGEAADRVLRGWKFPRDLIPPIVAHHAPATGLRRFPPDDAESIRLLALANHLAVALLLGSSGNLTIYPTEDLCDRLRVDEEAVFAIVRATPGLTEDMREAMQFAAAEPDWPGMRDRLRAGLRVGFRPIYRSARSGVDALRIFCERLADEQEGAPPNIIVTHICSPREAADVWNEAMDAERAAGLSALPVIVLSDGERCVLPPSAARGRLVRHILTPFNARLFVDCAQKMIDSEPSAGRSAA